MNNFLLYSSVAFIGSIVLYKYGKRKIEQYVMKKVMDDLDRRMNEEDTELFKPVHSNSAVIKIQTGGKTHSVYVPYNRNKSTAMLRRRVFLIKGEEKINISQKPGIPYIVCAEDLGGEYIIVENLDGNIVHKYSKNEIPNCF